MLIPLSQLKSEYNLNLRGVIHIGAHLLEEQQSYYSCGINNIIWIEGNPQIFEKVKGNVGNSEKIFNTLISNSEKENLDFHVTNDTQASSIFNLAYHKYFYSKIRNSKTVTLKNSTLKKFIAENGINIKGYNFLNLDIQGAELDALKSMGDYIKNIDFIYTEVNISKLYENCPLLQDIDNFLFTKNFIRSKTQLTSEGWGDAFYIRSNSPDRMTYEKNIEEAKNLESNFKKIALKKKFQYPFRYIKHLMFSDYK